MCGEAWMAIAAIVATHPVGGIDPRMRGSTVSYCARQVVSGIDPVCGESVLVGLGGYAWVGWTLLGWAMCTWSGVPLSGGVPPARSVVAVPTESLGRPPPAREDFLRWRVRRPVSGSPAVRGGAQHRGAIRGRIVG